MKDCYSLVLTCVLVSLRTISIFNLNFLQFGLEDKTTCSQSKQPDALGPEPIQLPIWTQHSRRHFKEDQPKSNPKDLGSHHLSEENLAILAVVSKHFLAQLILSL